MSLRACNVSRCASHTDKGTITWPGGTSTASGAFSGFGIRVHSLSTMAPSLTSFGIDALLKRLVAETLIGVDKLLFVGAVFHVDVDNLLDHFRHFVSAERRPKHRTQSRIVGSATAQLHLVKLFAFLVYRSEDHTSELQSRGHH